MDKTYLHRKWNYWNKSVTIEFPYENNKVRKLR